MTDSGVIRVWLIDGVTRHIEPPDVVGADWISQAAEAAVDNLGVLPMVASVDVPGDGSDAVVHTSDLRDEIGGSGAVAEALSAALAHALEIRPAQPGPLTIDASAVVLLAVRLRSRGTESDVASTAASLAAVPVPRLRQFVESFRSDGLVKVRGDAGRISLSPVGAARLASLMAESTDRVGRSRIEAIHREFLPINREFLSTVSAWQTGTAIEGDSPVIALRSLVQRAAPIFVSLSGMLPRFTGYLPRFERSLGRAQQRPEWIDAPALDSVHTVWFEFHEHLLATLGKTRTEEH